MSTSSIKDYFTQTKKQKTDDDEVKGNQEVSLNSEKKVEELSETKDQETASDEANAGETSSKTDAEKAGDEEITYNNIEDLLPACWRNALSAEFSKPYWIALKKELMKRTASKEEIFPPVNLVFSAFQQCPLDSLRVVVIGQDPYHDNGQAEGMSFSVPKGLKIPSSLNNMYKELCTDIPSFKKPTHGHLFGWAQQGVLLLNNVLTVKAHEADSHKSLGWDKFTTAVVDVVNKSRQNVVWLLWGAKAQTKAKNVDGKNNCLLKAAHPSGLSASRGFFGCKHFSKCNAYLRQHNQKEINWQV